MAPPPAARRSVAAPGELFLRLLFCGLCLVATPCASIKLRIVKEECMTQQVMAGDDVSGSFVALPGGRGMFGGKGLFRLVVTDPQGQEELRVQRLPSHKFAFQAKATGRYQFCLGVDQKFEDSKAQVSDAAARWEAGRHRDVLWELHVGHQAAHDKAQAEHLDELWERMEQLERLLEVVQMEQLYQKNMEQQQQMTSELIGGRVTKFAILRSVALIGTSVAQVMFIRWLFGKRKGGKGMLG